MSDAGATQANVISLNDLRPLFDRLLAAATTALPAEGIQNHIGDDSERLILAFMHHRFEADNFERQLGAIILAKPQRQIASWSLRSWKQEATRRSAAQRQIDRDQDRLLRASSRRNQRGNEERMRQQREEQRAALPEAERLISEASVLRQAVGRLLIDFPERLWFDEFYRTVRFDGHELRELDLDMFQFHLSQYSDGATSDPDDDRAMPSLGNIRERAVHTAVRLVADRIKKNEPLDWVKSLTWDGKARIDDMFSRIFKAEDTAFNRAAARIFLIGMVARLAKPGVKYDTILVLQGGQGLLKSSALEVIGDKWYAQVTSSVDSKDFLQEQHGVWLLEMAELHSMVSSRHGSAKVKATLSSRKDRYRLPYARLIETFERASIMVGTSNDVGWHSDVTGGRRIVPVFIGDLIDLELLKAEREQLFAEAWKLFQEGATWWEFPVDEHSELMERLRERSPFEEEIAQHLAQHHDTVHDGLNGTPPIMHGVFMENGRAWGTLLTVDRVAYWLGLTVDAKGRDANQRAITKALYGLGFEPLLAKTTDGARVRLWTKRRVVGLKVEPWTPWPPDASQGELGLRRDPFLRH